MTICSTCNAGTVYLWDLNEAKSKTINKISQTFFHKGENPYNQIHYDKHLELFIGCGPKNILSVFTGQDL